MRRARHLTFALCAALVGVAGTSASAVETAPDPAPSVPSLESLPEAPVAGVPPTAGATDAVTPPASIDAEGLVVRFAPGTTRQERDAVLAAAGARATDEVAGFVVAAVDGGGAGSALPVVSAHPAVAEVHVDAVRSASAWPDDPYAVWGTGLEILRAPRAWDLGTGTGTVIAVLDTSVDAAHEELAGRTVPGYDTLLDLPYDGTTRLDDAWHGTAVAGMAVAQGDNGLGIAGAAWGAQLMPVRVLDRDGLGADSDIAEGVLWAAAHGADVINLSLGGPAESPVLRAAIEQAVAAGSVVVAAAGNTGTEGVQYPAAYAPVIDGLVAVSMTDDLGALSDRSSWGDEISIAAPGVDVVVPSAGGDYLRATGTSFSAPTVSGAAALVAARGGTPAQVEAALTGSARDAGPRGVDPFVGHGLVDMAAALGLGRSVPVDQVGNDPGSDDGVPGRAAPLAAGATQVATLAPEGDEDWYSVAAPAPGWYRVTVHGPEGASAATSFVPSVTVLDGAGQRIGEATGRSVWEPVTLDVPLVAGGRLVVGVRSAGAIPPSVAYAVTVAPTVPARFSATAQAGPMDTQAVAAGDVTGDGVPDVVEVSGGQWLSVLPGLGDGRFGAQVDVPLGITTWGETGVGVLDADSDGDGDVVVGTSTGYVLLVQSGGRLTARRPVVLGHPVTSLRVSDLNADRVADLVLVGTGERATSVHLGTGSGLFVRGGDVPSRWEVFAVGDVTGDGRPDLVVPDGGVWAQAAGGSFTQVADLPEADGIPSRGVEVADVTGDGRLDVVRVGLAGATAITERVEVVPGRGDGTFGPARFYPVTGLLPTTVRAGDVDGDGRSDVVVAGNGTVVLVLLQRADGTLAAPEVTATVSPQWRPNRLDLADLDGDTHLDLVLAGGWQLSALLQNSLDRRPGPRSWVTDTSTAEHASGVPTRPTLTVTTGRRLAAGAVTERTVRLVDGATGRDLAASRAYDPATGVVSLRPTDALVAGHHYEVVVAGLSDTGGTVQDRAFRTWFTVGAHGDRFTPVEPFRVLDTRDGTGAPEGRVAPGSPIRLELGGVVVPPEATAVVLNVTSVAGTGGGNVRVYPTPDGPDVPPLVSNLNLVPGVDQPNAVTVALGAGGQVSLATDGLSAYLVADIAGYYSEGGATAYVPRDPVRVLDTRTGAGGVPVRPVAADRWVDVVVAGRNGVPADASAVVLNVTGTDVAGGTNVRVYPAPADSDAQDPPTVSNLNLQPGRDQANLVTVAVGDGGRVRLYTQTASVHLIADLAGYYSPTGDHGFVPITPTRAVDTRSNLGSVGALTAGRSRSITLSAVPAGAAAAVMNVTGVAPSAKTNVRVFPPTADGSVPLVSNLNLVQGRTDPNLAVVRLGPARDVSVYSQTADLHLVLDVAGYFRR